MNADEMIAAGQSLIRPSVYLDPEIDGPVAAYWHSFDGITDEMEDEYEETGEPAFALRITLNSKFIPGWEGLKPSYLQVWFDVMESRGGKIVVTDSLPNDFETELRSRTVDSFPPIEAVFLRGPESVGDWLQSIGWERECSFNDNFPDRSVTDGYEEKYFEKDPLYAKNPPYAVLGGWHHGWPDDDWLELIDEELLVTTYQESEPWIEGWKLRNGKFKVCQRIT